MSAADMYKFDKALIDGKLYSQESYEKCSRQGAVPHTGWDFMLLPEAIQTTESCRASTY